MAKLIGWLGEAPGVTSDHAKACITKNMGRWGEEVGEAVDRID